MTERSRERPSRRPSTQRLRYVAGALALLVAAVHLFHPRHGLERLGRLLLADPELLLTHPRPLAFVLSAIAIVAGIYLVVLGVPRPPIYALGMALLATYVVGYFAWHLSGHGGFLPGRPPHFHGLRPHEAVISHLSGDRWAATALVVESALFAVLAVLYRRER